MQVFQTNKIDFNFNRDGDITALFTIPKKQICAFQNFFNKLKENKLYDIEIKEHREIRSQNANKYMWVLCQKIAEKLTEEQNITHTKEDVYRSSIRDIGVYKDNEFDEITSKTFRTAWEKLGTGWITEQVDFSSDGNNLVIRFYYGSSTYNTKQMSKLINNLVEECKEYGIETLPPEELKSMLESWRGYGG